MKLTNKDQQIALIQQRRLTTQITHIFHKPTNAEQRLRSSSNQTKPNKPQNLLHRITEPSKSKPHNPSQLTHEEPQTEQIIPNSEKCQNTTADQTNPTPTHSIHVFNESTHTICSHEPNTGPHKPRNPQTTPTQ